jgi:hypothetical protein
MTPAERIEAALRERFSYIDIEQYGRDDDQWREIAEVAVQAAVPSRELNAEVWSLFDDWVSGEYQIDSEWGVGDRGERERMEAEIEGRRRRLVGLVGEPPAGGNE